MYDELTKYLEHSQFKKAEKYLEKEIIKTPDSVYLLTQMAYVLYKRNKEKRALDYAIRAEVIDNDDPLLLYTSGLILLFSALGHPSLFVPPRNHQSA